MPTPDQFWQYAREAVLSASEADTDDDKQNLLELAWIWTGAALVERRSQIGNDKNSPRRIADENARRFKCRFRLNVKGRMPFMRPQVAGFVMDR